MTANRGTALALVLTALLPPASAAYGQRLLTLVSGVEQASSAGDLGPSIGPVPVAVEVDLELLRRGPAWLEVPTPEGGVLSADRSVFEDRGGGDLMWSGGQPGAGYDTVVLTVEGGRLVGRFGAAGGGAYSIHAERDGRGGMAPLAGRGPDAPVPLCALHEDAEDFHDLAAPIAAVSVAADPPERVADPGSHDTLDILVAYTATAAKNWERRGGARAAIRHAGDYLKMVFRNNRLGVEPRIVHVAEASAALDRAARGPIRRLVSRPFTMLTAIDGELRRLRHEHRADLVHVFGGERALLLGACGSAGGVLSKGETAEEFSVEGNSSIYGFSSTHSWSTNHPWGCDDYVVSFTHEIGHGLGADHDPPNAVSAPDRLFRPYAMGHVDYDVMPRLGTAMSYRGQIEPFFSTPRIRPWGAELGIVKEQDNERLLRETVHIGVRYSDYLESLEGLPAQPTNLRGRVKGASALLFWKDNAPGADGYVVTYIAVGETGFRKVPVEGRGGATVPLVTEGSALRHEFYVQARTGDALSLPSGTIMLVGHGERIEAPSDVSATLSPLWNIVLGAVTVQWTDNSHNEEWFDVELFEDGELIARNREIADSESSRFDESWLNVQAGAEYSVRVYAYSSRGQSGSSETVTFRWAQPGVPARPTGVTASAIGPTTARVAWTAEPGIRYSVFAYHSGWNERRSWSDEHPDWTLSSNGAGPLWMDFEGLARGGRHSFTIWNYDADLRGGLPSRAYLAMGERGEGPRAPSDVSWSTTDDGEIRVIWRDDSSDELGFEVQSLGMGIGSTWWRAAVVPPNTTSVVLGPPASEDDLFRVFAWNERGYSRSSEVATPSPDPCRLDEETLCLHDSRFQVKADWWRADGSSGPGRVVPEGTDDSGLFSFFEPSNWEILVKVLDGCDNNGRMWVLGASTTDLGYRITVTDTISGESRSYENDPGRPAPAIVDTEAFTAPCVAKPASR